MGPSSGHAPAGPPGGRGPSHGTGMRIATYNVNGISARLPILLRWLAEAKPDVVCLQELKAPQDKFPLAAIQAAGYHALWHGQKGYNGVAVLARAGEPVEEVRGLPGTRTTCRADTWRRRSAGSGWAACTCRPGTRPPAASSTTSCG